MAGASLFNMFAQIKGGIDASTEHTVALKAAMLEKDKAILRTTNTLTKLTEEKERVLREEMTRQKEENEERMRGEFNEQLDELVSTF